MKKKYSIVIILSPIVIILDQWTKHIIHSRFQWGETLDVIPHFFQLAYIRNTGAAFGILQDVPAYIREPFFIAVPILAFFIILFLFFKLDKNDTFQALSLTLILSGAVGNLIDRIRFGWVIDFLYFHWDYKYYYPAFNVADSCIVVGVCMMFLHSLFLQKKA